jgi:NADH-quinone oxidoreductase subunit N
MTEITLGGANLPAILPEVLLLGLALIILLVDLTGKERTRRFLAGISSAGFLLILVLTILVGRPEEGDSLVFGGMLRHDWPAFTFAVLLLFAAAVTALFSLGESGVAKRGEYYALLATATMGLVMMSAAADLIMLFLAIETASISLYVLAGFLKEDDKSVESGMKYFLFGAIASAVMLYGFSLLYGFTGETNIYALADRLGSNELSPWVIGVPALLVLVGFGFKISMAPMHFWSPDVYEGAPTPITSFISTASKAAGFIVLVRVMLAAFPMIEAQWAMLIAILATVTMTIGNLVAISQKNIKRLLAYSSIAHAGYALIGLVALSTFGAASLIFYLIAYLVTNVAAFAVVLVFANSAGSNEIADYAGLSRRAPGLALALMIALLSLGGMPPLAGFVAKVYVFLAAVQSGWIWLAFVGVLNAIVGLYYYLTVLKVVYLYRSEDEDKPISIPRGYAIGLAVCIIAILVIGISSTSWLEWSIHAAQSFF